MTKKYVLFMMYHNYPSGGMNDLQGSFDTVEECIVEVNSDKGFDSYQIVDASTWQIIGKGDC